VTNLQKVFFLNGKNPNKNPTQRATARALKPHNSKNAASFSSNSVLILCRPGEWQRGQLFW